MVGRPFVKGQSGNPNGRPKRREVIDAMLAELKRKPHGQAKTTNAELLAQTAVGQAISGDVTWAKLVMEYVYGKPVQPVDLEVRAYAEQVAAIIGVDPSEIIDLAERRKVKAG
jgi:endonuclease III